jgi:NAD(P)-dependent dehydrogenase (short-subunit alcohol dehydrogenase family)
MTDPTRPVVLISGAANGIGAAAARLFAGDGWDLVLLDIAEDRLHALERELAAADATVEVGAADVRDRAAVQQTVDAAKLRFGGLDAVCANAGVAFPEAPLHETSPDVIRTLLDVNFLGMIHVLQAAVPVVRNGGSVVITSSDSGFVAHPGAAVYAATKFALVGLGRSLALEVAARRVRVNMVCPGGVNTALTRGAYPGNSSAVIAEYERDNPLGRIAQPQDVAEAMVFLSGCRARHVNGIALRVDGGDGLNGAV